ncbi:MAG: hypothetical protein AAFV45_14740 [Pseudomonadota bacterium]
MGVTIVFASVRGSLAAFTAAISATVVAAPATVFADVTIYTGGETGAYHSSFCPVLSELLDKDGVPARCETSSGTADNMKNVSSDLSDFGYGQLDVLALKSGLYGGAERFEKVRVDDVRECLFAVTKTKDLTNFGEVAVRASELTFVLPPEASGSAKTFEFLQKIDPYGLGQGGAIRYAGDTDSAINAAVTDDDTVALFVQFPDPANARFKAIQDKGGHIVPVLDRNLLDQRLGGERVYFAQETQVANAGWLASGTKVVTACTPLVLFTGAPNQMSDKAERADHEAVIAKVKAYRADALLPRQSLFARVIRRTRELSSTGAEKFVSFSEQARERAAPLLEKAREAAERAVDAAKPRLQEGDVPRQ